MERKNLIVILIEGGNKLIASAINSSQLNKIYWFSSEKIIGEEGKPSIGKLNINNLENSPNLFLHNMINLDNNYLKFIRQKIMFTGIITDIGKIINISNTDHRLIKIGCSYDENDIDIGASIACSGVFNCYQ